MKKGIFTAIFLVGWLPSSMWATIKPTGTYTNESGVEVTANAANGDKIEGDAPLFVRFAANASDLDAGSTLEWRFRHTGAGGSQSEITRYEDNPEYTFTESGLTVATLYVRLNNDLVDSASINITITESHLEMPNAFSPNDDGVNDVYGAKGIAKNGGKSSGKYRSIVDFHAWIFNRWGQKLYEWTDIEGYWDGTYNGSPCKDGVYFVLVKARGADGKEYNIRRDVNLIRNFNEVQSSSTSMP